MLLCIFAAIETTAQGQWVAKINTLSWLDPGTPTLQPGIEYRLNKRTSLEFTIGIPTKTYDELKNTDSTYNRYFKLKAEMKYFPGEKRSFYLGPEGTYVRRKRSKFDGTLIGDDGKTYGYDYAETEKSIFALAFKIGFLLPFQRNSPWLFDTWFGAGPRFMYMNADVVNRQLGGHGPLFWQSDREGFTTSIHVTFGLKIGYVIH